MYCVRWGDRVRISYHWGSTSNAPGGEEQIHEFKVGSRDILLQLSLGILGMSQGDRKRIMVSASAAATGISGGPLSEERLSRHALPLPRIPQPGDDITLESASADGARLATVCAVEGDDLVVRYHPPHDQKTVFLEILLISLDGSPHANKNRRQYEMGGEA